MGATNGPQNSPMNRFIHSRLSGGVAGTRAATSARTRASAAAAAAASRARWEAWEGDRAVNANAQARGAQSRPPAGAGWHIVPTGSTEERKGANFKKVPVSVRQPLYG